MKIVILDKSTLGEDIDLTPITDIAETQQYETTSAESVGERITDADAVVVNKVKLNSENLKNAGKLKLICVAATGYDNIDVSFCAAHGIAVCNVAGYSTNSVAQVSVSMALSLINRLNEYRNFVNSGEYSESGAANRLTPVYHEVNRMVWGVVGGGAIGTRVAQIAKALGFNVIMNRRKNEGDFPLCDIDTLVKTADVISLHVPLNGSTENLLNRQRISLMKHKAIVINTARGAVSDEKALCEAVKQGKIGGIGVDVYTKEPFGADSPFNEIKNLDNVILTPHMAWGSFESRNRCVREMALNIKAFINGEKRNRIV